MRERRRAGERSGGRTLCDSHVLCLTIDVYVVVGLGASNGNAYPTLGAVSSNALARRATRRWSEHHFTSRVLPRKVPST